jgi:hypothetical protein
MPENNRLVIDGCVGTYTLGDQEPVTVALLHDLLCEGQNANVLLVDLLIPVTRVNAERSVIEANGLFQWAGTEQRNENAQAVVYAKYRHAVTRSGDGHLAVTPPTIAPSPLEQTACEEVRRRMSEPLSDARLAQLTAMGKKDEPAPSSDPVIDHLRHEIALMESQQRTQDVAGE